MSPVDGRHMDNECVVVLGRRQGPRWSLVVVSTAAMASRLHSPAGLLRGRADSHISTKALDGPVSDLTAVQGRARTTDQEVASAHNPAQWLYDLAAGQRQPEGSA